MNEYFNQEEETMDEMNNNEILDTEVPTVEEDTQEQEWRLADGTLCSKSAFIREQFSSFNKSRKQISEDYAIPYRTVYGATVNMENEAEPTSRGRGVTFSKIQITEEDKVLFVKDGKVFINGEEQPEGAGVPDTMESDRNEWIKRQIEAGLSRGDIAKMLDLSYGVVYGLTKDADGTRQKYEVELVDGTKISRSEYIRKRVAEGVTKGDIAKELGVEYSVVWQATKKMKTIEEKFVDAVKALEKFIDAVENPDLLTNALKVLEGMQIKSDEADKITETEVTE